MPNSKTIAGILACALVLCGAGVAQAQEVSWQVAKSSGEVWITSGGAQQVSLNADARLKAGDNVRTGRNGRVLLIRGEERIVVSPNTVIGIPSEKTSDRPTTILQQAGSILLDVEKRNVQHFEVETPYLAAVVKGTQFRVSVENGRARVEVLRGQVQVADFKSGQTVLVLPGQAARSVANGKGGLQMSGKGRFNTIEPGPPREPSVRAINVPAGGLKAPDARADLSPGASDETRAPRAARALALAAPGGGPDAGGVRGSGGGLRIGAAIGEVKLDFNKVTNGLARGTSDAGARASAGRDDKSSLSAMSGLGSESSLGMGGIGRGNGASGGSGAAASSGGSGGGSSGGGGTGGGGTGGGGGGSGLLGTTVGVVNGVVGGVGGTVGGLLGGLGLGKK
jgi:hypothetical protein